MHLISPCFSPQVEVLCTCAKPVHNLVKAGENQVGSLWLTLLQHQWQRWYEGGAPHPPSFLLFARFRHAEDGKSLLKLSIKSGNLLHKNKILHYCSTDCTQANPKTKPSLFPYAQLSAVCKSRFRLPLRSLRSSPPMELSFEAKG